MGQVLRIRGTEFDARLISEEDPHIEEGRAIEVRQVSLDDRHLLMPGATFELHVDEDGATQVWLHPHDSLGISSEAAKAFAERVGQAEVDRFDDDDE